MSKQDVLTKTIEDERIQVGVLKASVDETEEPSFIEDDEEGKEASDESEKSGDDKRFWFGICDAWILQQNIMYVVCIFFLLLVRRSLSE